MTHLAGAADCRVGIKSRYAVLLWHGLVADSLSVGEKTIWGFFCGNLVKFKSRLEILHGPLILVFFLFSG